MAKPLVEKQAKAAAVDAPAPTPRASSARAPAKPESAFDLEVVILAAEDRSPIAGAAIRLVGGTKADSRSGTTGPDGIAHLRGLPVGHWMIQADAAGRISRLEAISQEEAENAEPKQPVSRTFLLSRCMEVRGTVVGLPDRVPIAGATVTAVASTPGEGSKKLQTERSAVSDRNGQFSVEGLPPAAEVDLTASAAGWTAGSASMEKDAGARGDVVGEPIVIELHPAATLHGTVTGQDGLPVEGAKLWVLEKAGVIDLDLVRKHPTLAESLFPPTCNTDVEGRYEAGGLEAGGLYKVMALKEGKGRFGPVERTLLQGDAASATMDIVLEEQGRLVVRILGPDGNPATGALHAWLTSEDKSGRGADVKDSAAVFEDVEEGAYTVDVISGSFAEANETVVMAKGQVQEREIRLEAGVSISGSVVDGSGRGIPRVRLLAKRDSGVVNMVYEAGEATTDEKGRFEIKGLCPGGHNLQMEQGPGDWRWLGSVPAPSFGLKYLAGGSLSFRLVLPLGKRFPTSEKAVSISIRQQAEEYWDKVYEMGRAFREENTNLDASTGAGTIRFVPPGDMEVVFRVAGYRPVRRKALIGSGGNVDLGALPLGEGLALRGSTVDESGDPVAGVCVMVEYGRFDRSAVVESSQDGSFVVPDLEPGAATVKTWGPFFHGVPFLDGELPVVVAAGMDPIKVILDPGVVLRGRVLRKGGDPVKGARVTALFRGAEQDDEEVIGTTEDDGTFEKRVKPGTWEVRVWGPDGKSVIARTEVELRRGERPAVEVRLDE